MKILISIFFIALTLSGEAIASGDLHMCEWVKSETCAAESLEGCEVRTPVAKIRSQVKNIRSASLVLYAPVYQTTELKDNSVNRLYNQHRFRKNTSPVYLSNQVFLI
jgi:hypothetical protein